MHELSHVGLDRGGRGGRGDRSGGGIWSPKAEEQAGDGGAADTPEKGTLGAVLVGAAAPAERKQELGKTKGGGFGGVSVCVVGGVRGGGLRVG